MSSVEVEAAEAVGAVGAVGAPVEAPVDRNGIAPVKPCITCLEENGDPAPPATKETQGATAPKDIVQTTANPEDSQDATEIPSKGEITFVDPAGTRWRFPYAMCKTWKEVKDLIKKVYVKAYLPDWCSEELDKDNDPSVEYAIITLKPHRSHILASHWEHLVAPDLEFTVQFDASYNVLDQIRARKAEQNAEDDADSSGNDGNATPVGIEDKTADIVYNVVFLQPNEYRDNVVVASKTSENEPVIDEEDEDKKKKETGKQSVLEEKREVARSSTGLVGGSQFITFTREGPPILYIRSAVLLAALKTVMDLCSTPEEYTPLESGMEMITTNLENGVFIYPFTDLCLYKDRLLAYKSDAAHETRLRHSPEYNALCDKHIDVLVRYLYAQPTIGLKEAEDLWAQPIPKTTFKALWLLFRPGAEVYVHEHGKLNAYVVESVEGGTEWSDVYRRPQPYEVKVWNLNYDGRYLTRTVKLINILVFDGEREIRSLPLYPTRFAEDPVTLHRNLVARGERFVRIMKKPTLQEFTGPSTLQGARTFSRARVVVDHTCQPWELDETKAQAQDKPGNRIVMKDNEWGASDQVVQLGLRTRHARCPCKVCESPEPRQTTSLRTKFDDYDNLDLQSSKAITEHHYFLCYSHVYAFVLRDRAWDLLDVALMEDPIHNKNVIDTLVMKPESNKQMIRAICEVFGGTSVHSPFTADFIKGKGEGQIILLHGPPGTGKTLTAESVAEYTARPLLSITAADLGHEPEMLERKLLNFFRDGNRWNAIVLLDEADVYLERRSQFDLRRNSIVSIFLRVLDYFQGILFLTTNRVGHFDEAFRSRIHVQIGYDPLNDAARERIWENHFRKLEDNAKNGGQEIICSYSAQEYIRESRRLQELRWNGREIRNAFQTAVALACFEAKQRNEPVPKLSDRHLVQVVTMSRNFKAYMQATERHDESQVAFLEGSRDDRQTASGEMS